MSFNFGIKYAVFLHTPQNVNEFKLFIDIIRFVSEEFLEEKSRQCYITTGLDLKLDSKECF